MNFLKLIHCVIKKNGIISLMKPQHSTTDNTVYDNHLQSNQFYLTLGLKKINLLRY